MLAMLSGPVPVLERVTVRKALEVPTSLGTNVRLDGEIPATGTTPDAERLTKFNGKVPGLLSAIRICAARGPVVVGEAATLMVQVPPGGKFPEGKAFPGIRHAQMAEVGPSIPPATASPVEGSINNPSNALKSPLRSTAVGT